MNQNDLRRLAAIGGMDLTQPSVSFKDFNIFKNKGFDLLQDYQNTNKFIADNNLMQPPVDEEADKKAKRKEGLQNLRDTLAIIGARRSGNYALAEQMKQQVNLRKQQEEQQKNRQAILSKMSPNEKAIFGEGFAFGGEEAGYKAVQNYRNKLSSDNRTVSERSRDRLMELNNNPNRTSQEEYEMNLLKTEVYGKKQVIPFFDSNGNPLPEIITNWDLNDKPELLNNLVEKGFATVGTNPSGTFNAPTSANDEISQKWQDTTNTLDLINKLSVVLDEGRDSPTVAGAIADLVNTGIYQVKSANKLLSFQENYPKEYSEKVNYIQNKHGNVLNKISADRGIATSTVMRLAYSLAKTADPGGRLSDKDIDSAILVIGGSGANVDKRLSVLGSLHSSLSGEYETYLETQRRKYPGNKSIQGTINRFTDLPTFSYSSAPVSVGKYKVEPVN